MGHDVPVVGLVVLPVLELEGERRVEGLELLVLALPCLICN